MPRSKKSAIDLVKAQMFFNDYVNGLWADLKELGCGDEYLMYQYFTDKKERKETAKRIFKKTKNVLNLKHLKIVQKNIEVSTSSFRKSWFTKGPLKYHIWKMFQKILNLCPDEIPAFTGKLKKLQLTKNMSDSEILSEIGEQNVFSLEEAAGILKSLTEKQPNGEKGVLLNNEYGNLMYVRLSDNSIVPADALWLGGDLGWGLPFYKFGGDTPWPGGDCVFVRG